MSVNHDTMQVTIPRDNLLPFDRDSRLTTNTDDSGYLCSWSNRRTTWRYLL